MSVLAPLLGLYTAAYLGLMIADFALREAYDAPPGLMPVYIALLGAYAADKEIRRWLHRAEPPRKGSLSSEIARRLAVSDATAKRLLAAMVAEGLIRPEGQGKGTVYRGAG